MTQSPRRFLARRSLLTGVTGKYPLAICPDRMCLIGGARQSFNPVTLEMSYRPVLTQFLIFLFFLTLCGYGLGGFWLLPGPGSPGTSRFLMLHS